MRLDNLVRNCVLGLALAGLMTAGSAAQDKDAAKDAAKAEKAAAKDARKDAKVKKAKKRKKGEDRDPSASTNKTKGRHLAYSHRH